jgi:phosphate-selective porin OprO/OprP
MLRSGRFTSTFGLESDSSSNDTVFLERGLPSVFVPPQLTGVLLHSESDRRRWDISLASAAGKLTECLICDVVSVAGRYSMGVDFDGDRLLHLGINYSRRWPDETVQYAQRPESFLAPTFVDTGLVAASRVDTALVEGAWLQGPFSAQTEFAIADVDRSGASSPTFWAVYAFSAYTLTGEPRTYNAARGTIGRILPARPLGDDSGGLGAFEVAARFSRIDLSDEAVMGGELYNLSLAFNWYPTSPAKLGFNVVRSKRDAWEPVWIFQGRLQIAY